MPAKSKSDKKPKKSTKSTKASDVKPVVAKPVAATSTPTPVAATPAPVPTPAPTPVPEASESKQLDAVHSLFEYKEDISKLQDKLKDALTIIKDLIVEVKSLEKKLDKDKKVIDKKLRTKVRRTGENKTISGFSKPGKISEELRQFLKLGKDDLIARTEVTKKITVYCKENHLQNLDDKRIILPDKALQKLLRISKKDELTYFNLQKYMKVHFPNKEGIYPTL